jgi:DNA-binding beta-propeller fold protein YncE
MNPRLHLALAATLSGALAAACTDKSAVAPVAGASTSPSLGGISAAFTCEVMVSAATLSCEPGTAAPTSGTDARKSGIDRNYVTLGGQGTYVQLASSSTAYDGSNAFTSRVTLRNLSAQSMNTANGTTADTGGVKVFFNSGPNVTGGTGTVTVANADGTGMFTGTAQPFFRYSSGVVLSSGATTPAKTWQFNVPSSVASFVFTVYVTTQIPGTQASPLLLYAVNAGAPSITVYGAGDSGTVGARDTIAGNNTSLAAPTGIAVDGAGNIYVANPGYPTFGVTVYAAGADGDVAPTATITFPGGAPYGVALDGGGNLYLTNPAGTPSVVVFALTGGATLTATITGDATGLNTPGGIAVGNGNIYVTNFGGPTITVYSTAGLSGTVNLAPTATITSSSLIGPTGITLDAAGNIYVANTNGNSITVFAAAANGASTPTATIFGTTTGLAQPYGIALDGAGNIYVGNQGNNSINVYAAGTNGNVAPTATIRGLNFPSFVAF